MLKSADWCYVKTQTLPVILKGSRPTSGERGWASFVVSGVERSYPEDGLARKQSSVSHSTTESEIMSFDAGLRRDGISALDLWDLVIEVLYFHARSDFGAKEV